MHEKEYPQTTHHLQHLERLLEISRELTSTMSLTRLLNLITESAVELTNTESAAILLLNENGQTLHFAAVTSHAEELVTISVPIEKSIAGAAFTSGQPVIVPDVDQDPRFFSDAEQQTGFVARSLLALPLQYNQQRIGVLEVENKKDDSSFNQEDIEILTDLAAQATVAIENARLTTNLEAVVKQRTIDLETAVIQLKQEIIKHKKTASALKSAEERWRSLVTNAPVHIFTIDQEGTILYTNRVAPHLTLEQVIGSSVYTFLPPKAKADTEKVLTSVFKTGTPQKYESCIHRTDGTDVWYENQVAPIHQDGETISAIFIATDITHRRQAEQLLREQQEKVVIMQERERFAQELHDGLGQVMGYINMQLYTAMDLLAQGHKNQLHTTLQKLATISQNSHADIRASIMAIQNKSEVSQNFLNSLNTYLKEYQQQYHIIVHRSFPENLPPHPFAPIVEDQIIRLIQESLTNVRKHAEVKEVRLMLLLNDEHTQIIIEDEGIGFDLPSQTTSPKSDMHFGLTIMAQRIQEIGGDLQIRTAPGNGTKVIIQIPRWPESDIEALRSLRIMLVDDHPLFLEGLQDRLTTKGIPVIGIAHDGKEAQELAFSLRPDLILMDMHMPLCDGVEATRQIKSVMPDVKIAMLTVAGDNQTLFSALKYGANGYLLKNMSGDLFLEQLSALARGEIVIAPEVATKMLAEFVQLKEQSAIVKPPTNPNLSLTNGKLDLLTPRQQEILSLVAQGMTYKEVGIELHLTESAIKYHMGNILKQLHVKKRDEAMALARQKGLT
jgi:PAS domain S-box-containing protein